MKTRKPPPVLLLVTAFFLAGCATPVAETVTIVPAPRDAVHHHEPALSRVAAQRIQRDIEARGLATILPASRAHPRSCQILDVPDGESDLVIYVWVQQVDLPRHPAGDAAPVTWGGLDLRGENDRRLAYAANLIADQGLAGTPSTDLFVVGDPRDPRVIAAADTFGATIIGAPGRFAEGVNEALEGILGARDPSAR